MDVKDASFLNRSNYLVGFLAALIGLAAFKDELAARSILIFGHDYSLLSASVPMTLAILGATYFGALAHFTANFTFTRFAISKYLSNLSGFVAIVGLSYPLIVSVLIMVTWLSGWLKLSADNATVLSIIASTASAIIAALLSFAGTRTLDRLKTEKQIDNLTTLISKEREAREHSPYEFLKQYEALVESIVGYLRLRGYGIGGRSLIALARILNDKQILSHSDLDDAGSLNMLRNEYAHGKRKLTSHEAREALETIDRLRAKIENALFDLSGEGREES